MSIHIYDYQVNHFVHMYSWEVPCLLGSSSIFGTHLSPLIWMYSKLVVKVLEWGWFGSLSYESTYQPWAIKYYSSYDLCGIATRTSYLAGDFFGGGNKRLLYICEQHILGRQKSKQTATLVEEMFCFIGNQCFNLLFLAVLGRCSTAKCFIKRERIKWLASFLLTN